MNTAINVCDTCRTYTLLTACACGKPARPALPARFSPDDRHAHLTRQAKESERRARGLL